MSNQSITAGEVLAELRKSGAVDEIRREVQLSTPDSRTVATAAVRDRNVEITVRWPECIERDVTATVAFWRFELAFLDDAPDARWYTAARIAETAGDVAVGLATALTATEGRTPLGYTSTPCKNCGGSGRQTVTLATGAPLPVECEHCDGAGELTTWDGSASAA
ncbi:Uncharacterised protein [Mycobacteroides abscessus subsp. abscessus]|uniref:hypothetical protein n=1 Tax=Mycobacteroides abscessus TaxID=36809 RepID=UPI0009A82946|nr:hypothetical protein [Mycobacteroides abscessus]SKM37198.1 Uncharacterised protein [Mycobacteroides abscessus subsp. abscessus]